MYSSSACVSCDDVQLEAGVPSAFSSCATVQEFPVYRERMPMQLLAYLRLARLTDPALLAKVCDCPLVFTPAWCSSIPCA